MIALVAIWWAFKASLISVNQYLYGKLSESMFKFIVQVARKEA